MLNAPKLLSQNLEPLFAFWQQHAETQTVPTFWTFLLISNGPIFQYINSRVICYQLTKLFVAIYEGWNFNSGNYLFTNDTK